jgi:hypothetical protein
MSELKVNKISPRSGTDVTLGDSGDTFTVPAGASIVNNGTATGFGATVTWDTTAKTTGFTAVSGVGYFCDTTSAGFTVTLPATPSAGDIVGLVDYAGTFDTNNLIIDGNGEDIEGSAINQLLAGEREGVVLIYVDSTQGWLPISGINEGTDALEPNQYSIDFLVVAGGGAGGAWVAGGGGAGGYRTSTQTVNPGTAITITVGDGGAGGSYPGANKGGSGSNSSISGSGLTTITSAGGGGGGSYPSPQSAADGVSGGSGGGAGSGGTNTGTTGTAGSGNTPSTAPSQGNNGGIGSTVNFAGGGGGGAGGTGNNAPSGETGGAGGAGTASSITGSSVTRAGGGGGAGNTTGGAGGTGGGGAGASSGPATGTAGIVNTGGGSGGARDSASLSGGKGVVILSMPLAKFSGTTTGSPTESDDGTTKVLIFNGDGSYTA